MSLRAVTWLASFAIHGGIAAFFLTSPGGAALEEGTGEDTFIVEQGVYSERIEAVEAPPPTPIAPKPVEEVKPIEEDETQHVIGSENGPTQDNVVLEEKPEVLEEVKPEELQIATVEPTEVAVDEQKEMGERKSGGDVTAMSAYRGRLFSHISKKKVNPRSKVSGTVVVRFTVSPEGELISREIATSSGSKMLDDAAVASIERAAPFPAMPTDAGDGPLVVSVPFKFSVR